ncbi:MAG: hypothetical protein Q4P72_00875 [Eubacteriales bacterium]|nr:hypothetical protein [Eubacteriales bacterium]
MEFTFICGLVAVLIAVLGQILIQHEERNQGGSKFFNKFNIFVLLSWVLMIVATFLTTVAFTRWPLSYAVLMAGIDVLLLNILNALLFDKKLSKKSLIGILLITIGVVIFLMPSSEGFCF